MSIKPEMSISPSPEARQLYSRMVARADDDGVMGLEEAMALSIDRVRRGQDPRAQSHVKELMREGWITPDLPSCGWVVRTD